MNILRQAVKSVLTNCVRRELMIVRGPRSAARRPRLALTFDDGPHPVHTPLLLDCLDDLNLRATFFTIGQNAEQYPDLIRRIVAAEHELGNHTYSHSDPRATSAETFIDEIHQSDQLLNLLTGQVPSIVRPPKGELNWAKLRGLWRNDKTVALWNVDSKDYRMTSTAEMTRWCHAYQPQDGDILLFHDSHPFALHAIQTMASSGIFERFEASTISHFLTRSNRSIRQTVGT